MKNSFRTFLLLFTTICLSVAAGETIDVDFDKDGDVDSIDLLEFADNYSDTTNLAAIAEYFGKFSWFRDADGDGYSDGTQLWTVSRPEDHYRIEELIEVSGDFNDSDPTINPDAPEICGDGIDQNCDGNDFICIEWEGDYDTRDHNNSLEELSGYTAVTGNLKIVDSNLTDLSGLENLNIVGELLTIYNNAALANILSLKNLTSVGGALVVYNSPSLSSLAGLSNISTVGNNLLLTKNGALTSISALENLSSVGGSVYIGFNPSLTSLSGLGNLSSIGGKFGIYDNATLKSLANFKYLTTINGDLSIDGNPSLTNLSGLQNLVSIGEELFIGFNDVLEDLSGLENLTRIGALMPINIDRQPCVKQSNTIDKQPKFIS